MTSRERVELFHLVFLRAFFAQLEDCSLVILKGGANLRFFMASPRFSEDMDLDVKTLARPTLARKVTGLFQAGSAMTRVLATRDLRVVSWSAPKQTDEVQRWKVALQEGATAPETTKVEFSRRDAGVGVSEPVPRPTLDRHRLAGPIVATHYDAHDAAAQKVRALLGRAVPQARDVFDLHLLLGQGARITDLTVEERAAAKERVLSFDRADFDGQVLAFLEPDERGVYAVAEAIDALQLEVAAAFDRAT